MLPLQSFIILLTSDHTSIHWLVLFLSKLLYVGYMLVAPAVILDLHFFEVLTAFLLIHISSGVAELFTPPSRNFLHCSLI